MNKVIYFIKEAVRGFYQAKLMTFVSLLSVGISLFFLGLVVLSYFNVKGWLQHAAQQVDIVAFVDDRTGGDSASLDELVEIIQASMPVEKMTVIDKDAAWKRFEKMYSSEMLEAVDENPFPVSIELSLKSEFQTPDQMEKIKGELESIEGIEGLRYSREWFDRLDALKRYFFWGAVFVFIVVGLALNFMISNTIKLTIYARKELVTNMRYVGATDTYIQMPFILEGMLQGLIGAGLAFLALSLMRISLSYLPLQWGLWKYHYYVFPIGVLFGWIGSRNAVRKFLS
ncbi:MAG: hypothetical protein GF401_17675 [Chitinivibrionales bacterium]|nr:hypothetical protein [Chitinivibrionales bacterium]